MTASACVFDSFMVCWRELFMRRGAPEDPGGAVAGVVQPLTPDLATMAKRGNRHHALCR